MSSKELLPNPVTLPWSKDLAVGFALDAETDASIPEQAIYVRNGTAALTILMVPR